MNQHKKNILHITYDMRIGGTEMVIKNIIEGSDNSVCMSILCIAINIPPGFIARLRGSIRLRIIV
jgi:hypothetical protein